MLAPYASSSRETLSLKAIVETETTTNDAMAGRKGDHDKSRLSFRRRMLFTANRAQFHCFLFKCFLEIPRVIMNSGTEACVLNYSARKASTGSILTAATADRCSPPTKRDRQENSRRHEPPVENGSRIYAERNRPIKRAAAKPRPSR